MCSYCYLAKANNTIHVTRVIITYHASAKNFVVSDILHSSRHFFVTVMHISVLHCTSAVAQMWLSSMYYYLAVNTTMKASVQPSTQHLHSHDCSNHLLAFITNFVNTICVILADNALAAVAPTKADVDLSYL